MNYDNLTNAELLTEVYLQNVKSRLVVLLAERLEIAERMIEELTNELNED
jgi:hypothetical protein